jgi:alpha-beta hydrolase superfamily lysophospholipase
MATLSDLRLRFWIASCMRAIALIDDGPSLLQAIRPSGAPPPSNVSYPHIQGVRIPTGHGALDARFSLPLTPPRAAVLICHGIGDRLSYWQKAQSLLFAHNVASLIFDYAGYGASTGRIGVQAFREDTQAAHAWLAQTLPPGTPLFLLGLSMGTGIAADAALHLTPSPDGLILAQPFRSLRAAATEVVRSSLLARLIPDVWRTTETIPQLDLPILLVHSDGDRLFPVAHSHSIHAAARDSQFAIPRGFAHNAIYLNPDPAYWQPILDFIGDVSRNGIR